jgi:hypothetical protein
MARGVTLEMSRGMRCRHRAVPHRRRSRADSDEGTERQQEQDDERQPVPSSRRRV